MTDPQKQLDALCRQCVYFFVVEVFRILHPGKPLAKEEHLEAMCWQLQEVAEGRIPRLLITIPPRHLKSICTSVALVAWMLGLDPSLKVIVASYGDDLARRHAADFQKVMQSAFYRRLFPATRINPRANRIGEMETTMGGIRNAVSLGGAVTGQGADMIIIDDVMKAQDALSERRREETREFYDQTLYSRLNDKRNPRIIAIQQRLHEDDFASYLIDKGTFEHLSLPAIADEEQQLPLYHGRHYRRQIGDVLSPEREPKEALDDIREEIGTYAFSAQYLQNPVPEDSCHLSLDRMNLIDEPPERFEMLSVVQSWDTAIKDGPKGDFSVCSTWGWHERWHLLHVFRGRLAFPDLKAKALGLKRRWRPERVLVEDAGSGTGLVQQLRSERHREFRLIKPRGSKLERFIAQTDILQSDKIAIPTNPDWFQLLKRELMVFPNGKYDDQVDSVTQFLHWAQRRGRSRLDRDPVTGRPVVHERPQRQMARQRRRRSSG
jgi:predicted phage terminase large subunit-like protein